jgi:hypothetical protein
VEIVNRFTGAVLRRSDLPNVREAVEEAVRGGARLVGAILMVRRGRCPGWS